MPRASRILPPLVTSVETFAFRFRFEESGCWTWKFPYGGKPGYGRCHFNGRNQLAHRVAYQLFVGPIPPGLFVCHHCDNPPCVNPTHLFVGTAQDNTQDMLAKCRLGRRARTANAA